MGDGGQKRGAGIWRNKANSGATVGDPTGYKQEREAQLKTVAEDGLRFDTPVRSCAGMQVVPFGHGPAPD